ncbi:MAG: histidine kinase [Eubacterium sp.]|nr:histidine kinase [Eubacterium sp.]
MISFFKGKLLAVISTVSAFAIIIVLSLIFFQKSINLDLIETPYMFMEGEYSVDGGEFVPFDMDTPIDDSFHTITFKGKMPDDALSYYNEISFLSQNLWYKISFADGTLLYENRHTSLKDYIDGYYSGIDATEAERQEFENHTKQVYPIMFDMPDTPGYTVFYLDANALRVAEIDENTQLVLEFVNPYENMNFGFSDVTKFTLSYGSGSNVGTGNYLRLFKDDLPSIIIFLIVSLFGIFFFPIAGFIIGKKDFRYQTFGLLCFFLGLYMLIKKFCVYIPLWIMDSALCPVFDLTVGHLFMIALLIYFRSNLTHRVSRIVSGVMIIILTVMTAAATILHLTAVYDIVAFGFYFNMVTLINTILMIVLAVIEIKAAGKESVRDRIIFFVSWIPLVLSLILDVIDRMIHIPGSYFYIYGLFFSIIAQIIRLIGDLRRQYLASIRYQQIQRELYEAKVSVMVSQIQPHFMYNALTSIAMMCTLDPEKAQEATITFSDYLRGNMDSIKQIRPVPFEQELKHLEKYLYIEKLRFDDLLNIEYDIQAKDFKLPLLSIQPLVENAVKHGVGMKEDGGTVTIATRETDTAYEVIVSDDGVGFDTENAAKDDGRSHVGMENTKKRLHDMCGADVAITSVIGEGTRVVVTLPKDRQDDEDAV